MLTALSVAHDCSMIDANDSVIHLTVLPPAGARPSHVEYTYTAVCKPEPVHYFSRLSIVRLLKYRVHSMLEKSLKMLEFGIKTSRPLKVLENR